METMLIAVTALSLAMAVAMAVLAWRLLREERRRADARVAVLTALADRDTRTPAPAPHPAARRPEAVPVARPVPVAARRTVARPSPAAVFDLPLRTDVPAAPLPEAPGVPVASLFEAPAPAAAGWGRAIALVLAAVAMATGVWVVWELGNRTGAAGSATVAPMELVSLAHDRQGDTLRITGLVQNPRAGGERRDVVAVAFLFDGAGTLVASGRAPLDFTRLAPGEESPFVILVPHAETVARYRLGFRTRDGRVLAHVDRRNDAAAAGSVGAAARPPADLTARVAR